MIMPLAPNASVQTLPRAKSAMTAGAALSKPTTSSMPASWGSAIEKPLDTMPTTTSLAAMPDSRR